MTTYVIDPPAVTAVPVAGGGMFPVRRVFCVGRNYAEHTREMGGDPDREEPFFFTKPADALVINGADMPYPTKTADLHHEMELVVAIGTGGKDIAEADTEMPRSCSIFMKSDRVRRASPLARTCPAIWIAPP